MDAANPSAQGASLDGLHRGIGQLYAGCIPEQHEDAADGAYDEREVCGASGLFEGVVFLGNDAVHQSVEARKQAFRKGKECFEAHAPHGLCGAL